MRNAAPLELPVRHARTASTAKADLASEQTLLGTVHYMAPERLEGREADAASDLFAFGAVMYEMATGRRAFESGSAAGVIAAILQTDPPPPTTIEPAVPVTFDWVIQKALAKNPESQMAGGGRHRRNPPVDCPGCRPAPPADRSSNDFCCHAWRWPWACSRFVLSALSGGFRPSRPAANLR